ncbi:hypothetical protein KUW19_14635 [Ferrimonas balearica]|uniref:hypothetical protein n=1 Tax=Ferrimonas balearica TaxID=44012 RepID=UPI001C987F7D|nr:hypothetical protein [Ferrimonas balearica]MBY6107699.1 hypothetical protein [Ferrimonas balearica]
MNDDIAMRALRLGEEVLKTQQQVVEALNGIAGLGWKDAVPVATALVVFALGWAAAKNSEKQKERQNEQQRLVETLKSLRRAKYYFTRRTREFVNEVTFAINTMSLSLGGGFKEHLSAENTAELLRAFTASEQKHFRAIEEMCFTDFQAYPSVTELFKTLTIESHNAKAELQHTQLVVDDRGPDYIKPIQPFDLQKKIVAANKALKDELERIESQLAQSIEQR